MLWVSDLLLTLNLGTYTMGLSSCIPASNIPFLSWPTIHPDGNILDFFKILKMGVPAENWTGWYA